MRAIIILLIATAINISAQDTTSFFQKKSMELTKQAKMERIQGNYYEAIEIYKKALNYEESSKTYTELALCYIELDQLGDALKMANQSLSLDWNNNEAFYIKGNIYMAKGNLIAAVGEYSSAIQNNPNDIYSYLSRAFAFADMNMHQEAARDLAIAIQISPDDAKAYYKMASIHNIDQNQGICSFLPELASENNAHAVLVMDFFCMN